MWWRGTREGYPRGVGLTPRLEQAFFGGETLRFPSGEPLVTQVEVAWGIDGSLGPENIHLGNLDAVADYVLLHFDPRELAALAGRPGRGPVGSGAGGLDRRRSAGRDGNGRGGFRLGVVAGGRPRRARPGSGLEMNLALSWKMTEGGAGGLAPGWSPRSSPFGPL
jgi:hypothetical protein